jgi:hypothetical protein
MEPKTADAGKLQQLLGNPDLFFRLNITFQVMAVADVSAGHQRTVTTFPQRSGNEHGIHPAGAHHPDGTNVGGVLHAGYPGQVGPGVGAPVAQKGGDFGRIFGHTFSLCLVVYWLVVGRYSVPSHHITAHTAAMICSSRK